MDNVNILKGWTENYWVVVADTPQFGKNEIMFEGSNFKQCMDYVHREHGSKKWIARIKDPYNTEKTYKVTHYPDGHYTMAEYIGDVIVGYSRVRKLNVYDLIDSIHQHDRKYY